MGDKLIDDATFAELRELEVSGMFQTASISRDGESVATEISITIIPAAISADGYRLHAAVLGLGGGRASLVGYVPYATDVLDGDVITSDGRTYTVLGVGYLDTSIGLALSQVGRG